MFDVGIGADLRRCVRALDPAFDIRCVPKGGAKHFLLVGTMRTPESAVHFGASGRQALGECVQPAGLFLVDEKIQTSGCHGNQQSDRDLFYPRVGLALLRPFLLPSSSLLRHSIGLLNFLYHDIDRPWQNVQRLTVQRENFPVHHSIYGSIKIEIDPMGGTSFRQRMTNMASVVERR